MERPGFSSAKWRKSGNSGDGGCVEVAHVAGVIGVRDTKDDGAGPVLMFTERDWNAFIAGSRSGEFDLDRLAN